ncbi:HisA/HisF-related TIM barrel protein [Thauera sp.]|jgi:phosphoribosylformimino-5-aminoimidazole carboxamide ribotide isomerase|uniref:HisA/HisF-related TIM barrel protein n=1 Tax=Thauera sp. TaxID=1905334 RepID=UPI002A35A7A3|nr:HisA/HisF-related TIM barrel protein [Thauera sp.]MDX9887140.1 HisA/HisF-related TIM barrel protein [Thauera sp.]
MQLIPVIDLMAGQVVRGVRGERSAYRPIRSSLCESSAPLDLAPRLLARAASDTLYIADLDALMGGALQFDILAALLERLPAVQLWVDGGFRDGESIEAFRQRLGRHGDRVTPIVASESLPDAPTARRCLEAHRAHCILSLDRRQGSLLDAADCHAHPEWWPDRVIVMTLDRVGADAGPDLDTLRNVQALRPDVQLIGAGGIRDETDLERAAASGANAWLVASALHDGRIGVQHPGG